jgi:hypothetical protein
MRRRLVVALLLVPLVAAACAAPSRPRAPHVPGWERTFAVEWATVERGEATLVEGHLDNRGASSASDIQLLVHALDADGRVIAQRVVWFGVRSHFQVVAPARAPRYRVSVYAYGVLFDDTH